MKPDVSGFGCDNCKSLLSDGPCRVVILVDAQKAGLEEKNHKGIRIIATLKKGQSTQFHPCAQYFIIGGKRRLLCQLYACGEIPQTAQIRTNFLIFQVTLMSSQLDCS
jgi:hypothetical protein